MYKTMYKKRVLVTGGCGYIGSFLIRKLIDLNCFVRCLDLMIYDENSLASLSNIKSYELVVGDIRNKKTLEKCLENIDVVIHLAAIVGDKPCEYAPKSAYNINFSGTQILTEMVKKKKVKKLIFASTCANYGISDKNRFVYEDSILNPTSLYAETKIDCENFLKDIASDSLEIIILRIATSYGMSYRTRFDLTVNSFAYEAYKTNKLSVFAYDTWRPYIHVSDICNVLTAVTNKEKLNSNFLVLNAGFTNQNFTKKTIAEKLKKIIPELEIKFIAIGNDKRSYKVNFEKIEKLLNIKNFMDVKDGFSEILEALKNKTISDSMYNATKLESLTKFYRDKEKSLKSY